MSTSAAWARCQYCGVTHLGGDGMPIVCPKLVPGHGERPAHAGYTVGFAAPAISDADVERIARRVAELLTQKEETPATREQFFEQAERDGR